MKNRRMHLNLFLIDFPITALTSILHRVTGILLFLFIPFILYFLDLAVKSNSSFLLAKSLLSVFYIKLFCYFIIASFIYHCVMGIKHIVMDLGFFEEKDSARNFSLFCVGFIICLIIVSLIL